MLLSLTSYLALQAELHLIKLHYCHLLNLLQTGYYFNEEVNLSTKGKGEKKVDGGGILRIIPPIIIEINDKK